MSTSGARNPLNRFGAKYFSQTDEDGITLEIVRRIGIRGGTFAELGVGDGLENNALSQAGDAASALARKTYVSTID